MGATFDYVVVTADNENAAFGAAYEALKIARHEHGHDIYSGHIGMKERVELIRGQWEMNKAINHAEGENSKWGPAYLYELKADKTNKVSVEDKKLLREFRKVEDKIKMSEQKYVEMKHSFIKSMSQAKSLTRSCKGCGSKVATKYIQTENCPVCQKHSLLSDTDIKRLKNIELKIKELNKGRDVYLYDHNKRMAISSAEKALSKKWIVAGWTSS